VFAKLDSGPVLRFWTARQDRGPWEPKYIVCLATRTSGNFQVKFVLETNGTEVESARWGLSFY